MTPPIDWENEPPSMVAERAARRAIEAISRVGTLTTDVAALAARVEALEQANAQLLAALFELADEFEALKRAA